jgi:hypothetical protein
VSFVVKGFGFGFGFGFQFSLFGNPGPPVSPVLACWGGISAILAILVPASFAVKGFAFQFRRFWQFWQFWQFLSRLS